MLEPGAVTTDAEIAVTRHDPAGLTVADAHTAMSDRHLVQPDLVRALADHERLADMWREPLRRRLVG